MVIGHCVICGKEIQSKYMCKLKKCCSPECTRILKSTIKRKPRIKLICAFCGKSFYMLKSQIDDYRRHGHAVKYCSRKCAGMAVRTRKIVECKNCGRKFETTRNKCCCHRCAVEYSKKIGLHKKKGYWFENGYKILYLEGDKSIKEHIDVMEKYLGRKLKQNECVHHINGNKLDNKISNLIVMTIGEHSRLHRMQELKNGKKLFVRNKKLCTG